MSISKQQSAAAVAAAVALIASLSSTPSPATDDAAHALAAKFAAAADAKSPKDLMAEEQDMLARAKAEALERKAAAEREAAEQEKAEREAEDAKKKAEAERIAREEADRKAKDEQRLAEEKRKADEQARLAAEEAAKKAEAERIAREEADRKAKDEQRFAEEKRKAEEQARLAAEETAKKAEAERIAREEADRKAKDEQRLAEEKRKAEEQARLAADTGRAANGPVTVLLLMDPGKTGIRRYGEKTADPVICADTQCWISSGAGAPARMVHRGRALGPGNTLGNRAAACNHHLGCVFRAVDLSNASLVQPIDLRIMRHDRREPQRVAADTTCEATPSSLSCGNTIRSATWRAWIVPESVAAKAGEAALLKALETGLTPGHQASLR